jgi:hypothetical protein
LEEMYRYERRMADAFRERQFITPGGWTEVDTEAAVVRCEGRCAALRAAIAALKREEEGRYE